MFSGAVFIFFAAVLILIGTIFVIIIRAIMKGNGQGRGGRRGPSDGANFMHSDSSHLTHTSHHNSSASYASHDTSDSSAFSSNDSGGGFDSSGGSFDSGSSGDSGGGGSSSSD